MPIAGGGKGEGLAQMQDLVSNSRACGLKADDHRNGNPIDQPNRAGSRPG
jgi:hypothetical protein